MFAICSFVLFAQEYSSTPTFDAAVVNIVRQIRSFPQEKVYLHTDKPYYMTGEKIFFRAHLEEAILHTPVSISRYVYVELINPLDSVVNRLKVRPDKGAYFGQISLPEELPEGVYKLRAYTYFMRNMEEAYFFSKNVRIGDPQSLSIKTETDFTFEEEKKVVVKLRFSDLQQQEYLHPKVVLVRLNKGKVMKVKPDKEGWVNVRFNLLPDAQERVMTVELEDRRTYKQYLRIPYPKDDYEVSFYPEGGQAITNNLCNIAFKALKADGAPEEVKGEIFNSQGESVSSFSTFQNGMGNFLLAMASGESFYAVCENKEGVTKRFELPQSVSSYALKINPSKDKIWVAVSKPAEMSNDSLYLLIHTRGRMHYAAPWDHSKEYLVLDRDSFPSGILNLLLFSSEAKPISERLVFIQNPDQARVSIQTDRSSYKKRERVDVLMEIKDEDDAPLSGNFSVSVTDDKEVRVDTCSTLYSYLLLSSELKGHIDCPACYFEDNIKSRQALDLLMMTHGWRRYDLAKAARGEFQTLNEALEIGQEISGTIKGGLLSKPSEKAKVSVFASGTNYMDVTETDKNGRFYLRGFEFPDSTKYVIHATSKRGRSTVDLLVDQDNFPPSALPWGYEVYKEDRTFLDYMKKADQKYTYENGMRMINLDEVTIKATYKKEAEQRAFSIYGSADNTLTEKEIEQGGYISVRDMLYRFPGVEVGPDYIKVRGGSGNPLLLVDNMEMDIEMLDNLNVNDIAQVDLLKSAHNLSLFGSRGANGVISVFSKTGKATYNDNLLNTVVHTPLGYHMPVEFYSPRYDTPQKRAKETPDLRSTIHWNPQLKTDLKGALLFDFYTADTDKTSYTIVLEGVTGNGKIVYYKGKVDRE